MSAFIESLGQQSFLFLSAFGLFPMAAGSYGLVALKKGGQSLRAVASVLFTVAFIAATALIAIRWVEAGRPPFKTLYESLLLFSWCTALLYVLVERYYRIAWFGFMTAGFIWLVYGYAVLKTDAEIVNLPAALQSIWFIPHVMVYFIGYAALFFAFIAAILYLVRPNTEIKLRTSSGKDASMSFAGFMHRAIQFGFILLTVGLVIGAIWAKAAWGDYWVWDPKENWALVSWLVYAAYLHLRFTRGFSERTGAIITIVGFVAVVFTYLGMNMLPTAEQSAHVYQ
jgi:cytochrome c-type biogenesis protein CcsB